MSAPSEEVQRFRDALRATGGGRASRRPLDACWQAWRLVERDGRTAPATPRGGLAALLERGAVEGAWKLPARPGAGWDTSAHPALPRWVTLAGPAGVAADDRWRFEEWPAPLDWVPTERALRPEQVSLLRGLRALLARDAFTTPETLHFRSLQVTGDEKRLKPLTASGGWLGPERVPSEVWNLLPTPLPLPWTRVGQESTALIVENVGTYRLLQRVVRPDGAVGVLVCGQGNGIAEGVAGLAECGAFSVLWYLGDLDMEGLRIARRARLAAEGAGLAPIEGLPGGVAALLAAAARLGAPNGWPTGGGAPTSAAINELLAGVDPVVRADAGRVLRAGCRIPEEALDSAA